MQPYTLEQLFTGFEKITRDIVFYLPRTSNLNQIAMYVPEGEKVQVTHYCIRGASKVSVPSQIHLNRYLPLINLISGTLRFPGKLGKN